MRVYKYNGKGVFSARVEDETDEDGYWEALMRDAEDRENANNDHMPVEHQQG